MQDMLLVARNEFMTYFRKASFRFATLAVPAISIIVILIIRNLGGDPVEAAQSLTTPDLPETGVIGYVDQSGVVQTVPPMLEGVVRAYEDSAAAEADLRAGELDAYYVIAPDYLEEGSVERVGARFDPIAADQAIVEFLLTSNLLEGADPARLALSRDPLPRQLIEEENVGERAVDQSGAEDASGLAFGLAYFAAMLIYVTTFSSAGYLLQSIATEKENRIMEVLLTSIRPFPLLAGKVLGLGLLGLMQTALWAAISYGVSQAGLVEVPLAQLGIDWRLGLMMLVYYVLGYGVYASMMGGIGALVPSVKESGPATFLVVIPAIIPLMFLGQLIEQPHSTLAVVLSFIPFTAPITMIVRFVQGGIPGWQIALSIAIMAVTVPLLLGLVARLFHTQTLLSSEPFSPRRAWAVLREG